MGWALNVPMAWHRRLGASPFGGATVLRALATSVFATAVDLAATVALARSGLEPGLATLAGGGAGGVVAFLILRGWVFAGAAGGLHRQAWRYAVVSAVGAVLNALAVGGLILGGADMGPASAVGRAVVWLGWSLPVARFYAFPAATRAHGGET